MEKWRRVWRNGIAPQLSWAGLFNLRNALENDDPRLMQGVVSTPPALDALRDRAVEGACAVSYCGWRGEGLRTVGQIDEFFARTCEAADAAFNEPAACRYFLNWFDDVPRAEMRRELLAEVALAMQSRLARVAA
jgi:hypothetical protein